LYMVTLLITFGREILTHDISILALVGQATAVARLYLYVGDLLTQFVLSRYKVELWIFVSK